MKEILLTGARGFIGRNCIQFLKQRNFRIHALTSGSLTNLRNNDSQVQWHQADLLDTEAVTRLVEQIRPTHLMHFGWYTKHGEYWNARENLGWVNATLHLVQEFHRNGGKRFVGAGTCAEYDWSYGYCIEEMTPLDPDSLYGKCKHAVFNITEEFARNNDLSFAWGRIFFVYGPFEKRSRLIAYVITSLLRDEIAQCSHGKQLRDFMYVEDVADAFSTLLDSDVEGAVNIATGKPLSLREILNKIGARLERSDLIQFEEYTVDSDEIPLLGGSTQRLQQKIGWQPAYSVDEGIDKTIQWWKEELKNN